MKDSYNPSALEAVCKVRAIAYAPVRFGGGNASASSASRLAVAA